MVRSLKNSPMNLRAVANRALLAFFAFTLASACAVNPATGKRELALVTEQQEIAMGLQSDQAVVQQMGVYPDQALQTYLDDIGQTLAAKSERPNLDWSFRVVDDPLVNAFAIPGGFIYITRGIMAHLNSEAQLAAVVGHEIGHVTARHSVSQISKQQLATLGLGLGTVFAPELAQQFGGMAQQGMGLLFLKYGRDDERQADDLGLRYILRDGYDPRPMPGVFMTLKRVSEAAGAQPMPNWLSSHPGPDERVQRLQQKLAQLNQDFSGGKVGEESYLRKMDGVVYGEDPRQGYFKETQFFHPEMAFQIRFPDGWQTINQRSAVIGVSANQDAIVQLRLSPETSASAALQKFGSQEGLQLGQGFQNRINGNTAASSYFQASLQQGNLVGVIAYIEFGGNVYEILSYTSDASWNTYRGAMEGAISSFDRLTDRQILAVQPWRLKVVKASMSTSLASFVRRHGSVVPIEEIGLINQLDSGQGVRAGSWYKLVTGQPRP